LEKRWARLAVRAQCQGVLDFRAPANENGLRALREELLLADLEREQSFKAAQLMLLARIAQACSGPNYQSLITAMLDEGLASLQLKGSTTAGLPTVGATDPQQLEQYYKRVVSNHRKRQGKS